MIPQMKCKKRVFCSVECRRKREIGICKECGEEFEFVESVRKKAQFCSIDCNNIYRSKQDGFREKISAGHLRRWASMGNEEKTEALKKLQFGKKINKLEAAFLDLMPGCVEYTGDHRFWVHLAGGPKNPDFVVRPFSETKKVIEVFGSYWHPDPKEADDLIKSYAEVGVDCVVVWDHEIKDDFYCMLGRLHKWLPGGGKVLRNRKLFDALL